MQKTLVVSLGALLMAVLTFKPITASATHIRESAALTTEQFRNAGNVRPMASCGREAGNPYDEQTDYQSWSAWRESGSWDSRNDC